MGIAGIHAIPIMITCMLQGTLCDRGIPRTFYGGNICSVHTCTLYCKIAKGKEVFSIEDKGKITLN